MADDPVSDFCILNGRADSRLSDIERLTIVGGAGLDRAIRMFSRSLSSFSSDQIVPRITPDEVHIECERMAQLRAEPEFPSLWAPPSPVQPDLIHVHGFAAGDVFDISFPSYFPAYVSPSTERYVAYTENRTSYVRLWEHRQHIPGRPTIVAIHGWTMGDQRVNSLAFLPGSFFSAGYNVALVELPFHGRRSPVGYGGKPLFPGADTVFTDIALAHCLHDLRQLALWLTARGHTQHVCLGMSLGAYVGQLWATFDSLASAIFLVPLVSMGDLAYSVGKEHSPDLKIEQLRDLFADHCCLERASATNDASILVICGRGDLLVPREQISLLRSHWPNSTLVWLTGGHAAHVRGGEAFRRINLFLSPISPQTA